MNKTNWTCPNCNIPIIVDERPEEYSYFIGSNQVKIKVIVPKGKCGKCNYRYEIGTAREIRNEAFNNAIEDFWKEKLEEIGANDKEIATVVFIASRLMAKLGNEKKRQVAAEMGRWLAGCPFM